MIAMPHGHVMCKNRQEANAAGRKGPSVADVVHFDRYCVTKFADFPGIDIGILSSTMAGSGSPDVILYQPSVYKLGTLSGPWYGSLIVGFFLCISFYFIWSLNLIGIFILVP